MLISLVVSLFYISLSPNQYQTTMKTLIKGTNLTNEQKALLTFRGMANPKFVKNHSFWFCDNKPCNEQGYIYPVCHSLSHLPY